MITKLIAFHGKKSVKEKYLARVRAHKAADEIIHGTYWEDGKGCAVGCTVHSDDHAAYETKLGIPRVLAQLEDGIFEALDNGRSKDWPEQFLSVIPVGADLSNVWPQFAVWMLVDETWGVLQNAQTDDQKEAIQAIAEFYKSEKFADPKYYDEIAAIYSAASAAASAAYSAADSVAYSAADSVAYSAADNAAAAYSAAAAAAYSAADSVADSAAASADSAASAASGAYSATARKWREAQADKLLELMRNAPIPGEVDV